MNHTRALVILCLILAANMPASAQVTRADFDSDNQVGFSDFFLFINAFNQPVTAANAIYDLDGNNNIGFSDFFIFTDFFGQKIAVTDPAKEFIRALGTNLVVGQDDPHPAQRRQLRQLAFCHLGGRWRPDRHLQPPRP